MSAIHRLALAGFLFIASLPPVQARDLGLSDLITSHRDDDARALLRTTEADSPFLALHLALLEGVINVRDGRYDAAVRIFRLILSTAPDYTPARLQLAKTLLAQGDTEAAHHHFEVLYRASREPSLRALAERALRAIEAERPYGFSVSAALVPSTNANRGSSHNTFDTGPFAFSIDESSQAQGSIGLSLGGAAHYDFRLGSDDTLAAEISASLQKYTETANQDQLGLSSSLTWTHRRDALTLSAGPVLNYHWNAWEPYLLQYGISGSVSAPVSPQDIVTASFSALGQDYAALDYRDGYRLSGGLTVQHHFSPSLNVAAQIGSDFERTGRDHLDHHDLSLALEINTQWQGGLITSLFAGYEHHRYFGDYPLFDAPREDHAVSAGVTIAHRAIDIGGFTPELTYRFTRQFSNVSFYDYDSHDISLGLSKAF